MELVFQPKLKLVIMEAEADKQLPKMQKWLKKLKTMNPVGRVLLELLERELLVNKLTNTWVKILKAMLSIVLKRTSLETNQWKQELENQCIIKTNRILNRLKAA